MENLARWLIACSLLLAATPAAYAGDASSETVDLSESESLATEDRIAELERTVQVLAEELERTRMDVTVPEDPQLKSEYGMGPAASKVYGLLRGLSIGGYGEMNYRNSLNETTRVRTGQFSDTFATQTPGNQTDFLRAVIYVGYKFTDSIVFNSEIEIEHADEIFLEFATLDFLWKDWANFKTGLMLMPVGWINEYHEPTTFYGVNRPDVERFLIPSTWRENGVGVFGRFGELVRYKLYGVNGMDGSGFSTAGIRGGRQKGSRALANDLAVVGRLDFTPTENIIVGGSFYVGNSGQDQVGAGGELPGAQTTLFDVHAQWQWRGLHTRALYTMVFQDEAARLTQAIDPAAPFAIAKAMLGGYAEVAYDVWQWFGGEDRRIEPFYRFEYYDTQWQVPDAYARDKTKSIFSHTVGLQFKPIPNVVLKADYRNRTPDDGRIANEINLGMGYIF